MAKTEADIFVAGLDERLDPGVTTESFDTKGRQIGEWCVNSLRREGETWYVEFCDGSRIVLSVHRQD